MWEGVQLWEGAHAHVREGACALGLHVPPMASISVCIHCRPVPVCSPRYSNFTQFAEAMEKKNVDQQVGATFVSCLPSQQSGKYIPVPRLSLRGQYGSPSSAGGGSGGGGGAGAGSATGRPGVYGGGGGAGGPAGAGSGAGRPCSSHWVGMVTLTHVPSPFSSLPLPTSPPALLPSHPPPPILST